ncbi:ABC transporter permease [Actinomadura scrupuli]|uniref:ABC transporter permease n=1 Tax=Actinomadura scrupuli TaxID=559629 RepID=UPI003D99D1F6
MNAGTEDRVTDGGAAGPVPAAAGRGGLVRRLARTNTLWTFGVLFGLSVFFAVMRPGAFATAFNIRSVFGNSAVPMVLAVGMTYVIITAGIDLSVGSVLVFSGVVGAKVMIWGGDGWGVIALATVAAMAAGTGWGVVNGVLVTKGRIPPLIATLGTFGMALGLAQVITNGNDVNAPTRLSDDVGNRLLLGQIPVLVLIAGAVALLFGLLLSATRFGRHTYAIGSNAEAARRVGIKVDRHVIKVYALSGLLAGLAGMLNLAKFGTTTIGSHTDDNLSAIAGAVLGGTSLFGGSGSIVGTVIGVLIPAVVNDGLIILGVQQFWLFVAVGAVLIVAVFFDQLRRRVRDQP